MASDITAGESDSQGISPEEQARINRIKRRNMILALLAGIIMLILGFLAGHNAKVQRSSAPMAPSTVLVLDATQMGLAS